MRFDLTEEQKLSQETSRRFFQDRFKRESLRDFIRNPSFNRNQWMEIARQGWLGVVSPETCGGLGLGVADLFPILSEAGRAVVPLPIWESALVAPLLLKNQTEQHLRRDNLTALADGRCMFAVALFEEPDIVEPTPISLLAERDGDSFVLSGEKPLVAFGADADWVIVLARSDTKSGGLTELTLFSVPAHSPGLEAHDCPAADVTYRFAKLRFKRVRVPESSVLGTPGGAWEVLKKVIPKAQVGLCGEMLGSCDKVIEMCIEYSKQRVQFGRPIGSFQAIKHRLADMWLKVSAAQSLTLAALGEVDNGSSNQPTVKMAKAMCNDAFRFISSEGIQVHGGIAFTWEHDLHLYFKRALRYRNTLGTSPYLMFEVGLELTQANGLSGS